jgi:predicted amidohydrolase
MRAALLQMSASDDPAANADSLVAAVHDAAAQGADLLVTPEVSNIVSQDRAHQAGVLRHEAEDETLAALRVAARAAGIWVLAGSLAVRADPPETRFANRSFLIGADGEVAARYDKIHMFDVAVTPTETFRESAGFAPGSRAVVADTPFARIGLTICYDVRFGYLYRVLAKAGAQVIAVPAAFSPGTGPWHWQPLLQARAIETGCWILAPAQTGDHPIRHGKPRATHGHSLVVSPWGEVVLDAGTDPGLHVVDLDLSKVDEARRKVPSLGHDRAFEGP